MGARCELVAIPGVVDLSDLAADADGIARIVLESVQAMLLKIALQMAHDDYTDRRERQRQGNALAKAAGRSGGRKGDRATHARIVALREEIGRAACRERGWQSGVDLGGRRCMKK